MPAGRPTEFKPEYTEQVELLCALGATDDQLAVFFGKTEQTINNWKKSYPEFFESIKRGKLKTDTRVADSLLQRALGAEWIEQKEVKLKETKYENGKKVHEEERVEIVDLKKAAPPDATAGIFWLKNRRPKEWRDKVDVTHKGDADAPPVFTIKIDNS